MADLIDRPTLEGILKITSWWAKKKQLGLREKGPCESSNSSLKEEKQQQLFLLLENPQRSQSGSYKTDFSLSLFTVNKR